MAYWSIVIQIHIIDKKLFKDIYNSKNHLMKNQVSKAPHYIYIPDGAENLTSLPLAVSKHVFNIAKIHNIANKKKNHITFIMCTKVQNIIFAKTSSGDLLEFNLRKMVLVQNHGKIMNDFGDLFIIYNGDIDCYMFKLGKFKDISDSRSTENLIKPQSIKLTNEMLLQPLIFCQYQAEDQGHGNLKGTIQFFVNDVSLYYNGPVGHNWTLKRFALN